MIDDEDLTLESSIYEIRVYVRSFHALLELGCETVGDILKLGPAGIRKSRYAGDKTIIDIWAELERRGVSWI